MKVIISCIIIFLSIIFHLNCSGQNVIIINENLDWNNTNLISEKLDSSMQVSNFQTSTSSSINEGLPCFFKIIPINNYEEIQINKIITTSDSLKLFLNSKNKYYSLDTTYNVSVDYETQRGEKVAKIMVECYKKTSTNELLRLKNIIIHYEKSINPLMMQNPRKSPVQNSVLASGKWAKIRISQDGVYKISGNDLQSYGFSLSNLNINTIKLYGNGGVMLPEPNSTPRINDLQENSIEIFDKNNNGIFDGDDYLLFYGKGTTKWTYDTDLKMFIHEKHLYDDYSYYFITVGTDDGKRISQDTSICNTANVSVNNFTDFSFHELNLVNLLALESGHGSGREWYGEYFNIVNNYSFNFNFPNIDATESAVLRNNAAARSSVSSSMLYTIGLKRKALYFSRVNIGDYLSIYANTANDTIQFKTNNSNINVQVSYNKPNSSSEAWLNFIEINAVRHLKMYGKQMTFRNPNIVSATDTAEYTLENANENTEIWDITNPFNPKIINSTITNNTLKFTSKADILKTYVAHFGDYLSPTYIGNVENQNLHALENIDYVIVYNPLFKTQAEKLANFYTTNKGLNVYAVDIQQIYNEFSSGTTDITAVRDFMKMLYDKANGDVTKMPKYLLLFGDASYDYKNVIQNNTNFIPTYESIESLSPTGSFCTDDYFGLLDNNEGYNAGGGLDISIGRFPVTTEDQANSAIDKTFRYSNPLTAAETYAARNNNGVAAMQDWRNIMCFVADDEAYNDFVSDADALATRISNNQPVYNIDKIYLDAYQQITVPGGQRYPDVNTAINQRVNKGALTINYIGHGGPSGWAHEAVLEIKDINSWTNYLNLPLFITATCEFTRYDDPEKTSAGELVFLNKNGGGIGLVTTSRVTYSSSNFAINNALYIAMFNKINGEYPTIGDLTRISKNNSGSGSETKKFLLIGDPALQLAYPEYNIKTDSIISTATNSVNDTIKALQKVTVYGQIESNGILKSDFNGFVYPTILDKKQTYTTLANDPSSSPFDFIMQKNIIYKGKEQVINGKFKFTFIVPRDIDYRYGFGKISYYATDNSFDGQGYTDTIVIGGIDESAEEDNNGPEIKLFMNDSSFIKGGITNENPFLLSYVFDEHGINTTGTGIGHDIVAVIDEHTSKPIVLNDYYQSVSGSYQKGVIKYPFFNLPEGEHYLSIKVWDIYNNSAEANTSFIVASKEDVVIKNLLNAPNPFINNTSFIFEHNQNNSTINVQILIYNTSGTLVRKLSTIINNEGYQVGPNQLVWDGTDNRGNKLESGVYIYKLKIQNKDGKYDEATSKLVLMK